MKCYVLEEGKLFNLGNCKVEEISAELAKQIDEICIKWKVRNLKQEGSSRYDDDGIISTVEYDWLRPEAFVVSGGEIVGYSADHFDVNVLVKFTGKESMRLGDYDFSDYKHGTFRVDRGHVKIVPHPDTDTNPYADEPRFHSQEEYDDYIKWRD